jgi:hypothetical protein
MRRRGAPRVFIGLIFRRPPFIKIPEATSPRAERVAVKNLGSTPPQPSPPAERVADTSPGSTSPQPSPPAERVPISAVGKALA